MPARQFLKLMSQNMADDGKLIEGGWVARAHEGISMMGTKDNPAVTDWYASTPPDEPRFTLRARDARASDLILLWADKLRTEILVGTRPEGDMALVQQAIERAKAMIEWRKVNPEGPWQ
jgi:hypothetical protein